MQEETKRKLNVLTGMQTHRLFAWIEDERQSPYCPEEYSSIPAKIARQATNDLGFTVTTKNIITAAKAIGYIKPKPKTVATPAALEVSCDREDKIKKLKLSFLRAYQDDIEGGTDRHFVEFAANQLGLTVTDNNVAIARAELGVTKNKPVNDDREDKSLLAKALIEVYRLLGKTPMNGLAAIAGTGIKKSSDNLFNL